MRRLTAALSAFLLVTACSSTPETGFTAPSPTAERTPRVREIARAPISPRVGNAAVWTGREMVVWGGFDGAGDERDAAAYDPGLDSWRVLPGGPLTARIETAAVWTGRHLFLWGGHPARGRLTSGGAELDPVTGEWRTLPESPLTARGAPHTAWTGREVLLWGGRTARGTAGDGAAYDPAARTWRRLPPFPVPAARPGQAVWTGTELIATAEHRSALVAAAYDPGRNAWRRLPDPRVSPEGHSSAVWADGHAVLFPDTHPPGPKAEHRLPPGGSYAPGDRSWLAVAFPEGIPPGGHPLVTSRGIVAWSGYTHAAVLHPARNTWEKLPLPQADGYREGATAVWTGTEIILWGGDACPPTADCLVVRPQERAFALRL